MAQIEKSVLVNYSARQMFDLVDDIASYPKFLPWCGGSSVLPQDGVSTHASIIIDYHHVRHGFTTRNTRQPPALIEMTLLDGPFKELDGHWRFIALAEDACKIEFRLHYEFSSKLLEKLVGPVFHLIASNLVEAFIQRAEKIYQKT